MNQTIKGRATDIVKLDSEGVEVLRYEATMLRFDVHSGYACAEAHFGFDRADVALFEIVRGDRMVEHFWSYRFYNIFEVHSPEGELRGFYCNVTRPADLSTERIAAEDLALDFVADTSGRSSVLDRNEFDELELHEHERRSAEAAIDELTRMYRLGVGPFAQRHASVP